MARTPSSRHRLHFPDSSSHHPVEVIARIRHHPAPSPLTLSPTSVRVATDTGYRDFTLDAVSPSASQDLHHLYTNYVHSRAEGVRVGGKCTIIMYGPTGSGKSYTMFGTAEETGIVYRALRCILGGEGGKENGLFVRVAVMEVFNEEVFDLLAGGGGAAVARGTPKVKLEVMGKKAKNATYITGNEAGKISKEVAKIEKRRIVKSTLCNERSSRSHCLIILDVPSVGGRLMLVDMAGSENIEQAGQTGFEAKMQTAKINQGNVALKRVVESIANGDSHVPFRDSKLTMLLQDSFEDDKSKILMILCASPDPKEMHKTISTLEYGAKAKCIVREAHLSTPKNKMNHDESSIILRSRIAAMNQFICKLQMDSKLREKERDDAYKELLRKEEEVAKLKSKLQLIETRGSVAREEDINLKVEERIQMLRFQQMETEEKMLHQQKEILMVRKRLEEMESERTNGAHDAFQDIDKGSYLKQLTLSPGDPGMVKSMEFDIRDQQTIHDVKEIQEDYTEHENNRHNATCVSDFEDESSVFMKRYPDDSVCLSVVFGEAEGEDSKNLEVDKIVVEENTAKHSRNVDGGDSFLDSESSVLAPGHHSGNEVDAENDEDVLENHVKETAKESPSARKTRIENIFRLCGSYRELVQQVRTPTPSRKSDASTFQSSPLDPDKEFNSKENSQTETVPQLEHRTPKVTPDSRTAESPISALLAPFASLCLEEKLKSAERHSYQKFQETKENSRPGELKDEATTDVYVKWEASKEMSGNLIKRFKVLKNYTLSDLRKQIESYLNEDSNKQSFTFLLLGDPSGNPVTKEREANIQVSKLPSCHRHLNGHLACLRPIKKVARRHDHVPFSSLENMLAAS